TKSLQLELDKQKIELNADEVEVIKTECDGFAVESDSLVSIALDTILTDELIDEGFAREIVNKIQNLRKTSGFDITDKIKITLNATELLMAAVQKYESFIRKETLAKNITYLNQNSFEGGSEWNINGEKSVIAVIKIN
ncbi:MAG: DUF5915 domain-containing protein, partial [Candidatus Zixiibacteriota bacterium]